MNLNSYIDYTLLKPEATSEEIQKFCAEALEYKFAAVCIHTSRVEMVKKIVGDNVNISGTVGFPFGNTTIEVKTLEAKQCIEFGANEIDFVINIGLVKDHKWNEVLDELKAMRKIVGNNILKVIFETCLLTNDEIIKCCELALESKMDFVKTSTGYSKGGATIEVVTIMKSIVKDKIQIKASGGIKTREQALNFIELGATRIGTSVGIASINGQKNTTPC